MASTNGHMVSKHLFGQTSDIWDRWVSPWLQYIWPPPITSSIGFHNRVVHWRKKMVSKWKSSLTETKSTAQLGLKNYKILPFPRMYLIRVTRSHSPGPPRPSLQEEHGQFFKEQKRRTKLLNFIERFYYLQTKWMISIFHFQAQIEDKSLYIGRYSFSSSKPKNRSNNCVLITTGLQHMTATKARLKI